MIDPKTGKQLQSTFMGFMAQHNITIVTLCLLGVSVFYWVGAQQQMDLIHASQTDSFASGDIVSVVGVVDGDEVLIQSQDGATTRLRIEGIKSFSPTVSDPMLSEYGKICFHYLKAKAIKQRALLEVADKRLDGEGRLLGQLFMRDAQGEYTLDLGLDLVDKGYSLVYTQYPFPAMEAYLAVQQDARLQVRGFWSNEIIAARAASLLRLWQEEQVND